ncbi:hypothetical protein BDB00DRAFT_564292 [Zychaea mexicana]|uniref:uncharacterized protein n=1 Tax=Zychaea mexicana TaxID=64656 RepID=UPI0022FF42D1|nr:uncharacterized protein BDB00DRAFT_564292 [Zychaea mexicana]KAI9490251.1 hypothetical protein BDB00DRAFT_564292 [Zychaea mexicana]
MGCRCNICNEGRWLPEAPYEIVGDTVMGLTHGPRKGRRRLEKQECPLFHAMRFNFFDKTHPKRDKLMKLCQQVGGGEVLSRRPPADKAGPWRDNDNVQRRSVHRNVPIIIVTDQRQLKKKSAKPLELYQVRDARWLLDCISRCDVVEAN